MANTVDPLGGSYFIESLTKKMEDGALDYFEKIDSMGGMVDAIEKGFPQREIQESAYQYQKAVERGDQTIVGVNKYSMEGEQTEVPTLVINEAVREKMARLQTARAATPARSNALENWKGAPEATTLPATIEASAIRHAREICDACATFTASTRPAFEKQGQRLE